MKAFSVQVGRSGLVYRHEDEVRFGELLGLLAARQRAVPKPIAFGAAGLLTGSAAYAVLGSATLLAIACATGVGIGLWWDAYRPPVTVSYELDQEAAAAYAALGTALDALSTCGALWRIESGEDVEDVHVWKRSAGAGQLLARRPATIAPALPRVLRSDVTPPAIMSSKLALYLLPDVLLLIEGRTVGVAAYDGLTIRWHQSRFAEDGPVPADAEIVGQAWKHPNRDGGPDRRFANNAELPVCVYETIHLTSDNGLNLWLQASRTGLAAPLWDAVQSLVWAVGNTGRDLALPRLN